LEHCDSGIVLADADVSRHPVSLTVSLGEGTLFVWVPAWNARTVATDRAELHSSDYEWPADKEKSTLTREARNVRRRTEAAGPAEARPRFFRTQVCLTRVE
jgi:hypothetical protein